MNGDFTRSTFDKKKHYRKVNMQQGRVQVDADWNEQNDIQSHHEHTFLRDLIGRSGTLEEDDGFKISENFSFTWDDDYPNAEESAKLGSFLRDNFDLSWIPENPSVTKSADGNTLTITATDGSLHSTTITRSNGKPVLAIDNTPAYEFLSSFPEVWSHGYTIGRGDYYVDGILCENEKNVEASRQPDIVRQQVRFLLFDWNSEDWNSAASDRIKNSVAGFVSSLVPAIGAPLSVQKTDNSIITVTNASSSATVTIELDNNDPAKGYLKFGNSEITKLEIDVINNERLVYYPVTNPSLPPIPLSPKTYIAYIDVWDQEVTHLEDTYIREKALGGVDTATRTRTAWQVKLEPAQAIIDKCAIQQTIDNLGKTINTGQMQARAAPAKEQTDMCKLYDTAGYRGLENHLYRVQVHKGGSLLHDCTFTWSRDNGVIASTITDFSDSDYTIKIQSRGRDDNLDFRQDTWIEITDDLHQRLGIPGALVKVKTIKETTIEYYPDTVVGHPITKENFAQNPKAIKWDSDGVLTPLKDVADYIELEDGVEVRFSEGTYHTGDYWLIPARANSEESIEWPRIGNNLSGAPQALFPSGVMHHYAPLAVVRVTDNGKFIIESDARSFFSSIADLLLIHYVGGDGQEALPDNSLSEPLRVAVTLGSTRISMTPIGRPSGKIQEDQDFGKAKVRFRILNPSPPAMLTAAEKSDTLLEVETNDEGIAECSWTLADGIVAQQVRAELVECGDARVPPIYFGATQPISFYYIAGDGAEDKAGQSIELSAGAAVGTKPANGSYKVKFSVVKGGASSVLSNPEPGLADGIATTMYKLSESPKRQQIKAELLSVIDNKPTNLQPIYYNVAVQDPQTSANTGLLELTVPEGDLLFERIPPIFTYGPFEHFLPGLDVAPAVMLGMVNPRNDSEVIFPEDFTLVTGFGRIFKPFDITPKTFKVVLSFLRLRGELLFQDLERRCINFRGTPPPNPRNPLNQQDVIFEIFKSEGNLIDPSQLFPNWGQIRGLNCGTRMIIALPDSTSSVQLTLSGLSRRAAEVIALNAEGQAIDAKMTEENNTNPQSIILKGKEIVRVTVEAPNNETLLHGMCYGHIVLRWWAIPAQENAIQSGDPVVGRPSQPVVEFDKTDYALDETVVVRVTDPNLRIDDTVRTVKVLITTDPPSGAVIELKETGTQTNIFEASFVIRVRHILLDQQTHMDVPGLASGATLDAIYEYEEEQSVTGRAQIR